MAETRLVVEHREQLLSLLGRGSQGGQHGSHDRRDDLGTARRAPAARSAARLGQAGHGSRQLKNASAFTESTRRALGLLPGTAQPANGRRILVANRSRRLTTPQTVRPSTTGRWRNPLRSMI